jgi:catechol 2,3-dioxygenase-like lactoylglutathione lyase family enzyme
MIRDKLPPSMALATATLNSVAMSVSDIDRSVDWFERVLDFRCVRRSALPALQAEFAIVARRDLTIELVEMPTAHRAPMPVVDPPHHLGPTGYNSLAFDVDDLAAATSALAAHGVPIVWAQRLLDPRSGLRSTLVRDPDGNLINFFERLS